MNEEILYSGEDFTLLIEAQSDDQTLSESLEDYKIVVQLSTNVFMGNIIASTEQDYDLVIEKIDDCTYEVNIPKEKTALLPEGLLILTIAIENKLSGERSIAELKTVNVKQPKI